MSQTKVKSGLPTTLLELSIQWQTFFPPSDLITLETTPDQLTDKLDQVEQRLEYFDAMVESLKTTDAQNVAKHMKYVTPIRIKVWQSCIDLKFSDRYLGLVGGVVEWEACKANMTRIIGKVDEGAKKRKARKKLGSMTRRVEANEPFWQFLARVTQVAKTVWTDKDALADAIESVWLDNLRPIDRSFLVHLPTVSGQTVTERLNAEAEYLDRGRMYKRGSDPKSIAQIEMNSSSSSYAGAVAYKRRSYDRDPSPPTTPPKPTQSAKPAKPNELASLMTAVEALVQSQTAFQEESRKNRLEDRNRLDVIEARLNSLGQNSIPNVWSQHQMSHGQGGQLQELSRRISAIESSSRAPSSSSGADRGGNSGKTSGQTQAKGAQTGRRRKYDPCFKCGLNGHSADRCKGTELTCNFCGKKGHIQSSRQFHPEINKFIGSKNE